MRTILATLLALVPLTLVAPAAEAENDSTFGGRCEYADGNLFSAVVVASGKPEQNPVTARVTCWLRWQGTVRESRVFTGTGVVFGQRLVTNYPWDDRLEVCTRVEFLSTGDPGFSYCTPSDVSHYGYVLWQLTTIPDPYVCPMLKSLAPGLPPDVLIEPDGDVIVRGSAQWDCPPYDEF